MKTEFNRSKKWKKELDICIRCTYCYEHCPLFKLSNWETDSPRGKLLLLYSLLTGEIEPSKYITEKIMQCFHCKNCEKSCSALVPITDILDDARADLIEAGFDAEGTMPIVNEDVCSGCGMCVTICKHEAVSIKEESGKRKAVIDRIKCKSCGSCVAACPSGAMTQKEGFKISPKELLLEVRNSLLGG